MTMYSVVMKIIRVESGAIHCENCTASCFKQLVIEREVPVYDQKSYWHFACALMSDIANEGTIVRLARQYKGKT